MVQTLSTCSQYLKLSTIYTGTRLFFLSLALEQFSVNCEVYVLVSMLKYMAANCFPDPS